MSNPLRHALSLIRRHRKEFIVVNAAFFGLFAATMTVTLLNPEIQPAILDTVAGIVRTDLAVKAYLSGNLFYAVSATLAVNLGVAVMLISIPSFLVPFFGVVFAMVFAAAYGVTLAPIGPYAAAMVPHSITVLIEFQAYIIAAFGAYLTGRAIFLPAGGEKRSVSQRYTTAAARVVSLYALVVPLLLLGAVYEAFEIIYLVGYFI
ncbi:stage II sporulation protein M [Rhizobiales bacterium RZME27]|uniref:Stage II sporulation protein M n=2 Tax=Endobacterium cereale TaxID=2663029 RepID=A0A6A8A9A9_9HYPH|nr:stage II sporulation protein M [Endobacterium cereale]MQY45856.1 stage II sporulation protein M [Endobacterium cereale]